MSIESVRCQIVVGARHLAKEKGLDYDRVKCPVEHVCNGAACIFVPGSIPPEKTAKQLDKFYEKLEKHEKLAHSSS